jgi:beta-lactamase regulating signal transducer with metallopeptidase domain
MRTIVDYLVGSSAVSFGLRASAKATVLLLIAAFADVALRRHAAAARHLLWTAALIGALAVPIVSWIIDSRPIVIPVPPSLLYVNGADTPAPPNASSGSGSGRRAFEGIVPDTNIQPSISAAPVETLSNSAWHLLVIVWACGALFRLLPFVLGLLNLGRVARRSYPISEQKWMELVHTLSARLGLRRRVRLVKSSASTMPLTWGWIRPVVLLPGDAEGWPTERRRVVLLHELAHVKRLDCLTQQLAQWACAVYWFNPLFWWASMRMMVERETACDDLVLLSGVRPSEYAGHLLAVARERRTDRGVKTAAVAMARQANLERRLRAILDVEATPSRLSPPTAVCGLIAAAGMVVSLTCVHLDARPSEVTGLAPLVETARITLRGRVVDARNKPATGAHVVVLATLLRRLTSSYENTIAKGQGLADNQGRFRLDLPRFPDGDTTIVATAPGLGAGFSDLIGSEDEEITIRLGPEQVVRGRVIDLQGVPAAGVVFRVSALWTKHPDLTGFHVTTPLHDSIPPWLGPLRTDARGCFTLDGLPRDADLTLQVRDDRFALQEFRIATGHDEPAKETVLPLSPPHLLEGRVTFGDSGQPVAGAHLHVVGYQTASTMQSFDRIDGQTGPDGRYRISASVAHHYGIVVDPPQGSPYFLRRLTLNATVGTRQELNVAMQRGILVRGRIHELGSGQPVAGAIVVYRPKQKKNPIFREDLFATGEYWELSAVSGADGSFRIPALPGQGHLLVKGPNSDFVPVRTSEGELEDDLPSGASLYPVGLLALNLDAGANGADVNIPVRRGGTLVGRVVDPDGQTVPSATIYSDAIASAGFASDFSDIPIEDGKFTLSGLDPEKTVSTFVFDAKSQLGALLELSVPKDGQPVTVRLQPCGSARARFVDRAGKPLANVMLLSDPMFGLEMAIGPSPSGDTRDQANHVATTLVDNIDGGRYQKLRTDAQGQLTFPSLIPGATYRVMAGEGGWVMKKEFVAQGGKNVDLSEITIMSQAEKLEDSRRAQDPESTKP